MKFLKIFGDIINSEGPILEIIESIADEEVDEERLYIKGNIPGEGALYAKVNNIALEMFFQGRITLGELFLLRSDEGYILESGGIQRELYIDEDFLKTIHKLNGFEKHFYSFDPSTRCPDPFDNILRTVNRDYKLGLGYIRYND